jgi:hypothetical protein
VTEIALQLQKDFGLVFVAAVVAGLLLIWAISHFVAQPAAQVSILWGMIQYTKKAEPPLPSHDFPLHQSPSIVSPPLASFTEATPHRASTDKRLFVPGSPFPCDFEVVKPGSPLSLAKVAHPSPPAKFGHLHGSPYYEVSPEDGPFKRVSFSFTEDRTAPLIDTIIYYFRDEVGEKQVREGSLQALGTEGLESIVSGTLIWKNVNGFRVEFKPDRCFKISKPWGAFA